MDGKEHLLTLSQQSLQYMQGQPSQRRRQKSLKTFVKTELSSCVHSTCEEATDKKHGVVVSKEEDHLSIIIVVKGCPLRGRSPNQHHRRHHHLLHNRPKKRRITHPATKGRESARRNHFLPILGKPTAARDILMVWSGS